MELYILVVVGVLAVFCTSFMAMGLSELFDIVANHSLAISCYFVSIAVYMTAGKSAKQCQITPTTMYCVSSYT